jgi:NRPS condensation-like uncharacterized protein
MRKSVVPLSVTNLGRLDFPTKIGQLELDKLFFVPPSGPFLELVLGVVTGAEKLVITINYMEETRNTETVKAIKERVLKHLKAEQ